jgi:hypothetical protein
MTDFSIGNKVSIVRNSDKLISEGTIQNITSEYINKGAKHWGKEECIYISFETYDKLLLRGSPIFCTINGINKHCYINNLEDLSVCEITDNIMVNPYEYKISWDNIVSMLITKKAYTINKI